MFKDTLEKQQPVVHQILMNKLQSETLPHALLLQGESASFLKDAALYIGQSVLCQQHVACETCASCVRVSKLEHPDCLFVDGSDRSIKKEDILKIQKEFLKTSLEGSGKHVYILHQMQNMTVDACNSLLKFLEEPQNNITAILTIDHIEHTLSTISSRCQTLSFKNVKSDDIFDLYKEDIPYLDLYFLGNMISQKDILNVFETDDYQHASHIFKEMYPLFLSNIDQALFYLQTEGFSSKKGNKKSFQYFIELWILLLRDTLITKQIADSWYMEQIKQTNASQFAMKDILLILLTTKDYLVYPYNLSLLIDQTFFKIKEVIYNE